ncbi:MAG TPA: trimeric intracellular cation channel family protein [Kiritimatiellia bacterium]|nr:trimeric intracellular cation channel family protein [Kiritimatiellia bacterium]HMP34109.1 trimeric intracellular cation channel family protein [Kiritimatiellia bacterium]
MSVLYAMSLLGVSVFAVSGALTAGRKNFDIFGVVVIAVVTAIGGGTIRDLLLDRNPVFWIGDTNYLRASTAAALLTVLVVRYRRPPLRLLLYADGLGLALFTISGTRIAESVGVSPGVCVLMGCLTGVAGGVFRDVLSGEVPMLLRDRELYATAAIGGSIVYLVLRRLLDLPETPSALTGMATVAALRFFSLWWKWRMPVFRFKE